METELDIHEILFNDVVNGKKTKTTRLGKLKISSPFHFRSSYTNRKVQVNLVKTTIQKYNIDMEMDVDYDFINDSTTVTIIEFKVMWSYLSIFRLL